MPRISPIVSQQARFLTIFRCLRGEDVLSQSTYTRSSSVESSASTDTLESSGIITFCPLPRDRAVHNSAAPSDISNIYSEPQAFLRDGTSDSTVNLQEQHASLPINTAYMNETRPVDSNVNSEASATDPNGTAPVVKRGRGRPRKNLVALPRGEGVGTPRKAEDGAEPATKKGPGRPRKSPAPQLPVASDTQKKSRGRPRKHPLPQESQQGGASKIRAGHDGSAATPKRGPGRPPKSTSSGQSVGATLGEEEAHQSLRPNTPGRKRKRTELDEQ